MQCAVASPRIVPQICAHCILTRQTLKPLSLYSDSREDRMLRSPHSALWVAVTTQLLQTSRNYLSISS